MSDQWNTIIENADIFKRVDKNAIRDLSSQWHSLKYTTDEKIYKASEFPGNLYIIRTGWVWLVHDDLQGRRMYIDLRGPGQHLGAMSLLVDQASPVPLGRSMDAFAASPCELLVVPGPAVKAVAHDHPIIFENLCRWLATRLWKSNDQLASQRQGSLRYRIVWFFNQIVDVVETPSKLPMAPSSTINLRLPVKLTNSRIAEAVAGSDSRVSEEIGWLKQKNVLVKGKDNFYEIVDIKQLRKLRDDMSI